MASANGNGDGTDSDILGTIGALRALSEITSRAGIASRLGQSFDGDRDLYSALGYKKTILYRDYLARYLRQDVARAVIDAPVSACWRQRPRIVDSTTKDTPFETAWIALARKLKVWHYFARADRLVSIGSYAALFIGFDDNRDFAMPVAGRRNLLGLRLSPQRTVRYLTPFSQVGATPTSWQTDETNPRFGQPETYSLQLRTGGESTRSTNCHWSRLIHIVQDPLDDQTMSSPSLEPIWNRLQDLETLAGGSSEMFWRGAFPGYNFKLDPQARLGAQTLDDMKAEAEKFTHNLTRILRLQGVTVETLQPEVADPTGHVEVQKDLIAAAMRIPKRVLFGAEKGELAGGQDQQMWLDHIDSRRREHCEIQILRPFIDRLIEYGALPEPQNGEYTIDWPALVTEGAQQMAQIGELKAKALAHLYRTGAEKALPMAFVLRDILAMDESWVDQVVAQSDAGEEIPRLPESTRTKPKMPTPEESMEDADRPRERV
jgi:hypothetical protein